MKEKLESNGRIWNTGTFRADSKQMQAIDRELTIYF